MCFCVTRNGKITALLICVMLVAPLPHIMYAVWRHPDGWFTQILLKALHQFVVWEVILKFLSNQFSCDSFRLYNMEASIGGSCDCFSTHYILYNVKINRKNLTHSCVSVTFRYVGEQKIRKFFILKNALVIDNQLLFVDIVIWTHIKQHIYHGDSFPKLS